jgi:ATP-binding cassette subfamily A (ABC1) protein 3
VPATVRPAELASLCSQLGNASRANSINAMDPGGSTIHNAMQANGLTSGEFLIGWFVLQDYTTSLKTFITREFGGVLLEQHEQNFRFNIPSEHLTLAEIFSRIEAARARAGQAGAEGRLEIQEYAVSQTTLEQVFNGFAAQQEEEQGPIRGMEQAPQAPTEPQHEQDNV